MKGRLRNRTLLPTVESLDPRINPSSISPGIITSGAVAHHLVHTEASYGSLLAAYRGAEVTSVGGSIGPGQYQTQTTVLITRPQRGERNSIGLIVESSSSPLALGGIALRSSGSVGTSSGSLAVQYITLKVTNTGFTGVVTRSASSIAAGINSLTVGGVRFGIPTPSVLAVGTRIGARVSGNSIVIGLQGNTIDGFYPFQAIIQARRFK